ncbi:MAG: gliding motility-associated C-terminal domain-containing protein [Marinilabiliaceae bacterium]|nr:gliding motility-associated C-terminal domain-containing protein [Marinilabiliaceae bacterium]
MKRVLIYHSLLLLFLTLATNVVTGQSCVDDNYCDNSEDIKLDCPDVPTWTEYYWKVTEIDSDAEPGDEIPDLIRVDGSDYYFTPNNVPLAYQNVEIYVVCIKGTPALPQGKLWKSTRIRPAPQIFDLTGPAEVCVGETYTMSLANSEGSSISYRLYSEDSGSAKGFMLGQNGQINYNISTPVAGDYTYYVVAIDGDCSSTMPDFRPEVMVKPLPTPTFTAEVTEACVGTGGYVYATQAGMSDYNWNVSPGGTITAGGGLTDNSVTVTWNAVGAQTVSVNYDNAGGCDAAAPTVSDVTVSALPMPTFTAEETDVCDGSIGNVYTTQLGMSNYVWTVSAGGTITAGGAGTDNSITITWNGVGAQTVSVNYDNAAGCGAALPVESNVTVNALPTPTFTAEETDVCTGSIGNVYTTQAGMSNYVWAVSAGGTITAGGAGTDNSITITWNGIGAQTVSVNYDNAAGCDATLAVVSNVTVNALPTPTFTTEETDVCAGSTGNVYTTQAGMSNYVWTVSAGGTIAAGGAGTDNSVTVIWNGVGAQTVSVNYDNAAGCDATSPTVSNVTVYALPTPTFTAEETAVCDESTGNVYTTQPGMSNYVWIVSAGGTITGGGAGTDNSVTVAWNGVGAQTVTVNYDNTAGCDAAIPVVSNVTVNALPTPTFTAEETDVCAGSTGNVYTTQVGMSNYVWTVSAGGTITAGGTGTDNSITITWNGIGAQTVSVNYDNAAGCDATSAVVSNVTVNALPTPTFTTEETDVCAGSTGNVYTTQVGMSNYVWTVSAGGTITAGGAGTDNSVTVTWNGIGAQTVSVNYDNAAGCDATSPTVSNVTVNALPTPTFTAEETDVCAGSTGNVYTTQAGMSNYVWTVSAGGTITSGGTGTDNSITITWNVVGAQIVSVNYDNAAGCDATSAVVSNVTVNALPTPTFTAEETNVCAGSTGNVYTTQAGMSNYVWAVSAGGTITAGGAGTDNSITITWNGIGAQTVSVNYDNAAGCDATLAVVSNVTVNALPTPTFTTEETDVCAGSTGNVYTTQAGMSNYVWTVSAGGTIAAGGAGTDNSVTVIWNGVGAQTVSVNYDNAAGCDATSPTVSNVTVYALPTPTFTAEETAVCDESTGNVYTTQPGMSNYVWIVSAGGTITGGGAGTDNSVTVAWNGVGAQTVTVNYDNTAGCDAAIPVVSNVTVNALPTPTFTAEETDVCAGSTGNVYTTQVGMSNYVWTVSAGGTITAGGTGTDNSITITWNGIGAQTVSVNYDNAAGCDATSAVVSNVTVNALPTPTFTTEETDVCAGSTGNVYTTQVGMSNYVWTVSAGGTITAGGAGTDNSVTVTWNGIGAQTVSVNYDNAAGCDATSPTVSNVTVNALPTPTFTAEETDVCAGSTGNVYTTQAGMSNYVWTVSAGGTITSGGTGTDNSITITWNVVGAQIVSVNYDNAAGCDATSAVVSNVTVNALPTPTFTAEETNVCAGSTGNFYTTQAGMSNYVWTVSAGGTITAGGNGTDNSVTVTWTGVGAQTVSVNYDNAAGCDATSAVVSNVTVNALPTPTFTVEETDVCAGSTGNVYTTQAGMSNYVWTVSAGGTITAGGTGTDNSVTVTWNGIGAQTVSVNYDNVAGCDATSPTVSNVTVNALPTPTFTAEETDVCAGSIGNVYTTQAGMSNYVWIVSAGGTITAGGAGTDNSITITWNGVGVQTVSVNYDNAAGCDAPAPAVSNVTVNALPIPTFTTEVADVCAGTAGNVYTTQGGMSNYVWTVSAGGTITSGGTGTDNSVTVTWLTAGAQTVSVNYDNAAGCDATSPIVSNVTVNEVIASISISSPGAEICAGTPVVFNANGANGSSNYNYEFFRVRATIHTSMQDGNTSTYTDGSLEDGDQIYVIVTDNTTGCIDQSASIIMTVNANPVVTLTISSAGGNTVCNGTTVDFEATSGYGNYVFYVNNVDVQNSASNTYSSNTLVTGDAIYVVASSGAGCSAASVPVITMTVHDLPTATLTSDQPADVACENETVTFTAGGGDNYEFFVDAVSQGAASPLNTFQYSSINDFTVSVRVIDGNNCEDTEAVAITISKPVAGLTATLTEICVGQSVTFTAIGGAQYEFFKDAISVQGPNASATYVDAGLTDGQVVTVKVIDAAGCEDTHAGITITVNANPTATLSSSDADHIICEGESVTFTGSGSDTYHFFVNGISVQGPSTTDTYTTTALVNDDEVSVLVTNSASTCFSLSSALKYTVNSNPSATLTANPAGNIIVGTSVTFAAGGGTDYEFFINGISVQALGNGNAYTTNALVNGDVVAVNVHNAAGCISTETLTMTVLDGIQGLNVLSSGVDHCQGDVSTVSIYVATPQNGVTYDLMRTSDDGVVGTITHDGTNAVQWDNIPGTEEYRIEAYYLTVPADRLEMNNRITVTENPLPSVYQITPYNGSETGCNGGTGWIIGVADSDNNIDYNLLLNGALVETVAGDGNPINFSAQSVIGVYTVQAVTSLGCTIIMDGNFTINGDGSDVPFNVYSIPADGRYCAGDVGIEIRLDGSLDNTVNYVVYKDGVDTGVSVLGNSSDISLGLFTADGMYTVRVLSGSGCEFPMNGSVDVQTIALPVTHNLEATNGGHYCFGDGTGLQLWLAGQELGVEYQLYLGGVAQGTPITGTVTDIATPLFFPGTFLTTGTYSVTATIPGVGCQSPMNNTLDIVVDPLPFAFDVTSDGDYCTGSVTYLRLNGSEADVEYRWEREGDAATGSWTDGTGGLLSFEITGTDTYYIVGRKKDGVTSCTSEMNGRFAISEKPYADLTKLLTVKAGTGTDCSTGAIVIVESSEAGVVYELIKGGVRTGNSVTGDGTDVEFPNAIVDIAATYNAYASLNGCEYLLTDDVLINVPGAINQYSVTGAGDICNGDPGQQFGLSATEAGVTYTLYLADAPGSATGTAKGNFLGDGLAQLFPLVNEEGEYFVIGDNGVDCTIEMLNRVTLTVNPLPVAFKMIGSGFFCDPLDGAEIGIDNSEVDVSYTLQYDDGSGIINRATAIGVAGGDTIIFGKYTDLRTYEVVAITDKGCTSSMNGEVLVQQVASPTDYQVVSDDSNYCDDQAGVELRMEHSETDVVYEVFDITNKLVASVTGDGSDNLVLGTVTAGTYSVYGSYGGDACQTAMHGGIAIVITELTRPAKFNVTADATDICGTVGTTLRIDGSEVGVIYQLYISGIHEVTADRIGTGNPISWDATPIGSGIIQYEIVAVSGGICDVAMGSIDINNKVEPVIPVVLRPDGDSYCDFNSGVRIGVQGSVSGESYQLIETTGGTSVSLIQGDGTDKFFSGLIGGTTEYIVEATNNGSGCTNSSPAFTITATLSANKYIVSSDVSTACTSSNVIISLNGSDLGVDYELLTDGVASGTLTPGTGNGLEWTVNEPVDGIVIYEVFANHGQACELSMGTIEVIFNDAPAVPTVLRPDGDTYCDFSEGVRVGVQGSISNENYQLIETAGGTSIGFIQGDGNDKFFVGLIGGTTEYRIDAINNTSGCTNSSAPFTITATSSANEYNVSSDVDNQCANTDVTISLSSSDIGIEYELLNDDVATGQILTGTGSRLEFTDTEPVETDVVYEIKANRGQTCERSMGTVAVRYKGSPLVFNVNTEGNITDYCADIDGVKIGLDGSTADIGYRLYNSANEVVDYKTGDGNSFYFINDHAAGTYRVDAVDFKTGCPIDMTGMITLVENRLPDNTIQMEPDNGPATVTEITLTSTEDGIRYQLMKDGVDYGASVEAPGSSAGISFGMPTSMGVYTVRATNIATGCTAALADQTILDSQEIEEKHFYSAKVPVEQPFCSGENRAILIENSQNDVIYTLSRDGQLLSGNTGIGDGNNLVIVDDTELNPNRQTGVLIYGIQAKFKNGGVPKTFSKTTRIFSWPNRITAKEDTIRINPGNYIGSIDLAANDEPKSTYYIGGEGNDVFDYSRDIEYSFKKKSANADPMEPYFGDVSIEPEGTVLSYQKRPDFLSVDSVRYYVNILGCPPLPNDSATVIVIAGNEKFNDKAIIIPNALTPNGDGKNDYFEIFGIEEFSSSKLEVFNRWGTVVYRSKGPKYDESNLWDGSANEATMVSLGDKLPSGTYFYVFTVTVTPEVDDQSGDITQEYNGYIELRR